MSTSSSKKVLLLLMGIYLLSSNCRLSNRYNVTTPNEDTSSMPLKSRLLGESNISLLPAYPFNNYHQAFYFGCLLGSLYSSFNGYAANHNPTIANPYQSMRTLDRIIGIQKTQNERIKYGGTTVYLYDEQGRIIHAHTGGNSKEPYYKIEYIDNQLNIIKDLLQEPISEDIDRYVRLVGIMTDKEDLLKAPLIQEGPFGHYGSLVTPERYEQIRTDINQRYAKWQGIATTDLMPPLAVADAPLEKKSKATTDLMPTLTVTVAPLRKKSKAASVVPKYKFLPAKSKRVCISVARSMGYE